MIYTQKDYDSQLTNNSSTFSSLMVSFANLLSRFNKDITPIEIEKNLLEKGITNPSFDSLSIYDPLIKISSIGDSGQPLRNDAIMKFNYISQLTGKLITHYCLVKDANNGIIIDSSSGVEKSWNVYGGPRSWAVYNITLDTTNDDLDSDVSQFDTLVIRDNSVVVEPSSTSETLLTGHEAVNIPVKIKLADPNLWQGTYKPGLGILDTTAIKNVTVNDLSGENPSKLLTAGTKVPVVGRFEKNGIIYYRTAKSVADNTWYGIPAGYLIRSDKLNEDDDINAIYNSPGMTSKDTVIKTVATLDGRIKRFFNFGGRK